MIFHEQIKSRMNRNNRVVRLSWLVCADLVTPSAAATAGAGLRSATSGSVAVACTTSSLGDRSFAVTAPRMCNNLLLPLRRVHSVHTFRRQLKHFCLLWLFSLKKIFFGFLFQSHLLVALLVLAHVTLILTFYLLMI